MPGSGNDLIKTFLQEALAAERAFEGKLRSFALEGDDDEVQAAFVEHADETGLQVARLTTRLQELGGASDGHTGTLGRIAAAVPSIAQSATVVEERLAQNLITAYTIESAECAFYEVLAALSQATGDHETESLARQIQVEEQNAATRIWRFLPSRAKIAFNMLTLEEVDPSVETRIGTDRIVE